MTKKRKAEDLQLKGLKIYQDKEGFCFGTDAVLLSSFAEAKKGERVLDLGCGNGIIPILMSAKSEAEAYTGVEIQEEVAALARENIELNSLEEKIEILCGDIKEIPKHFKPGHFQLIVTNPPYVKAGSGICREDAKGIARHELKITLAELLTVSAKLLIARGRFCMVHRPERLPEILEEMRRVKIEPKRLRMVHAFAQKEATLVLIEGLKEGKNGLKVEAPLILHEPSGEYTAEAKKIYAIKES